jgi:hypothetical protein
MSYTKYHDAWAASHLLSGAAFNHVETQWDEIKTDADAHNHDTRYYTKTLSDATFFTASTSYSLSMDADMLDGQHFSDLLASVMPLGATMIWSGTDATVPSGWHICDGGTYGGLASPDLRDRFVIGAGGDYDPGDNAGPATYNGTITPTGSVTIGNHQLTTAELPAHNHSFSEKCNIFGVWSIYDTYYQEGSRSVTSRTTNILEQTTGNGTHTHTGSTVSLTAIDPRPKYRGLYYIIKYA